MQLKVTDEDYTIESQDEEPLLLTKQVGLLNTSILFKYMYYSFIETHALPIPKVHYNPLQAS